MVLEFWFLPSKDGKPGLGERSTLQRSCHLVFQPLPWFLQGRTHDIASEY
jgi:hypothetical protein